MENQKQKNLEKWAKIYNLQESYKLFIEINYKIIVEIQQFWSKSNNNETKRKINKMKK